jgi:hypothetical protein
MSFDNNDEHAPEVSAERLYYHLKSRKEFGVTDPRNILFANVGLISPAVAAENSSLIAVGHRKTEAEVYNDLARYFFDNLGDFSGFLLSWTRK